MKKAKEMNIDTSSLKKKNNLKETSDSEKSLKVLPAEDSLEQKKEMSGLESEIVKLKVEIEYLSKSISSIMESINALRETIDIYKKRDIEQTNRIRQLEYDEKYDYIENIVRELIRLRDIYIKKKRENQQQDNNEQLDIILKHLDVSLERCNVYPYDSNPLDLYNPEFQKAVGIMQTSNEALEGRISECTASGYYLEYTLNGEKKKRIINFESIIVYQKKN